jgi:hypothetical protein
MTAEIGVRTRQNAEVSNELVSSRTSYNHKLQYQFKCEEFFIHAETPINMKLALSKPYSECQEERTKHEHGGDEGSQT